MNRRCFLGAAAGWSSVARAAPPGIGRWAVITIGNLSRNRYWGEPDDRGVRGAICTCTLVEGPGFRLLVDPSLAVATEMTRELDRRTGLKPSDITAVFVTHEHPDHYFGIEHFGKAAWYAAAPVAEILNTRHLSRRVDDAPARLFGAIEVIPTPGHTRSHHSLLFRAEGKRVLAAGDAVATRDFFRERRNYYNAVDPPQGTATMDRLAAAADLVIPGHDNYFQV